MEAPFSAKFKFSIEIGRMSDFLVESGIQYIQIMDIFVPVSKQS